MLYLEITACVVLVALAALAAYYLTQRYRQAVDNLTAAVTHLESIGNTIERTVTEAARQSVTSMTDSAERNTKALIHAVLTANHMWLGDDGVLRFKSLERCPVDALYQEHAASESAKEG